MRFLKLSFTTTGSALFGLDLVLIALIWPLTLWGCGTDEAITEGRFGDLRIIGYPVAALVLLYAMGLYRRNAIVEPFKTAARIPLVVGMGCVLALLLAVLSGAVSPERFGLYAVQNQIEMFGLAAVSLTVAAFLARLVFSVLVRSGTLRRRVLVVGAGQRAYDLLWMVSKEGTNLNYDVRFLRRSEIGGDRSAPQCRGGRPSPAAGRAEHPGSCHAYEG